MVASALRGEMSIMRFVASAIAAIFGFISGVLRNARTFHPDGRTFLGTVTAETPDPSLLCAGKLLEGRVLMRNRKMLSLNSEIVCDEAQKASEALLRRAGI